MSAEPKPTRLTNTSQSPIVVRVGKRSIALRPGTTEVAPADMAALRKSDAFRAIVESKKSPIELPGASAAGLLG